MYEFDFHQNPVYSCTQTSVVFNQLHLGEKIVCRAMKKELRNFVESGLAVYVSRRKRKSISISSLPPLPGSHPYPCTMGHARAQPEWGKHTANNLKSY